uniref:Nucleotide-diphospho-sugar transferase n=1 Tax=Peronospora matthiolae TaxID=2874970 RepID=A0AAV1TSI3_9STRA
MQRQTFSEKSMALLQVARSDHYSRPNILRDSCPSRLRSCVLLLVLCGLWMLVMMANLLGINQIMGRSISVPEGDEEVHDSSYRPPSPARRDLFSTHDEKRMEKQLIYTIHETAQRTIDKRGIVLPLYDDIATLGVSLILELRAMDVHLPIEIPYCGDLKDSTIRTTVSLRDASVKVFCESLSNCYELFRSFDVKIVAVILSRFEEVMLLDADTLFFESPVSLWDTDKYLSTGTLFFCDRFISDTKHLGKILDGGKGDVLEIHDFMSRFDVSPFKPLGYIERPRATSKNMVPVKLKFSPSEHLLTSHSWNYRAGHEMDSSLVLWNKKRQPQATAILGAFVAVNRIGQPPSYGDKELFYAAAELAETQYAFSDFGTGGAGWDFRDYGPGKSVLCGSATHYYPVKPKDKRLAANVSVLYLNSDDILVYDPKKKPVYYTQARPYQKYPAKLTMRGQLLECLYDETGVRFSPEQEDHMLLRQRFHEIAEAWLK